MTDLARYNEIYDQFCEWVEGIEEDDPLPPEIRFIYFVFSDVQGMNVLQYAGCEDKPKVICSFDYCPLEAQFFHCNQFLKLDGKTAMQYAALLSQEIQNDPAFEQLFFGREIRFVKLGEVLKRGMC